MELKPLKPDTTAAESLQAVLAQAEEEHWLERPNAPLVLRGASFFLDLIFIYLITHSIQKLLGALAFYVSESETFTSYPSLPLLFGFLDIGFQLSFIFFYLVLSVCDWGGTLGKLLLGLRVINAHTGKKLDIPQTSVRLLLGLITNVLSLAVALSRPDRNTLHDQLAGSVVKRVRGKI